MNRRERFLTALKGKQPDRVPMFDFLFQRPMYQTLIGHMPDGYNGPDAVRCALALGHDGVWLPFGGFSGYQPVYLSPDVYKDEVADSLSAHRILVADRRTDRLPDQKP